MIVRDIVGSIVSGLTRGSIRSRIVSGAMIFTILSVVLVIVGLIVFREPLARMVARPVSVDTSVQHRAIAAVDQALRHHAGVAGGDRLSYWRGGDAVPAGLRSQFDRVRSGECVTILHTDMPAFFRTRGTRSAVLCPAGAGALMLEFLEARSASDLRTVVFDLAGLAELLRVIERIPSGRYIRPHEPILALDDARR